ncbi:hypothetical protein CLOSBL3_11958 [Clostridiaceae bacterium BL-3]|nr:hypothetical protein CLOSBL3_11958 [Clostridiaceae bacterium BL-3]
MIFIIFTLLYSIRILEKNINSINTGKRNIKHKTNKSSPKIINN